MWETVAMRNCQNELPVYSASPLIAEHGLGRVGSSFTSGGMDGAKHPKDARRRALLLWYTDGTEFKQYQEGSHVGIDDDSQG